MIDASEWRELGLEERVERLRFELGVMAVLTRALAARLNVTVGEPEGDGMEGEHDDRP